MHPSLILIADDPAAQALCLAAILAWSRRFTPLAAPDAPDGLMLDIAGVAHLFGGEPALMRDVTGRLAAQGFSARGAIADTPELAGAFARFASGSIAPVGTDEKTLMRLAAPLPLAALRLSEDQISGLAQAGLRRIGDILHRPRAPLAARRGRTPFAHLDAMLGRAKSAISPVFEAPAYVAERRFSEGIARREDVEGTLLSLAQELSLMLERHGEGLRQVAASFFRVDGVVKSLEAGASRPLRDPKIIARLFRERIDSIGEDGLETGYGFDLVRLAATEVETLGPSQTTFGTPETDLFEGRAKDEDFADLIDRLGARLGPHRVLRLAPRDSHVPEFASAATSYAWTKQPAPWARPASLEGFPTRPLRLFERPERIDAIAAVPDGPPVRFRWRRMIHEVAAAEGPERIAPEWWKGEDALTRDYFRVEDASGHRFWLYRQGLFGRETAQPHWFLHGLFG